MPTRLRPARRRLVRHLVLAVLVAAAGAIVIVLNDAGDTIVSLSMATAYSGLLLLGLTLVPGPLNVLRGRPNPTSTHLRRDIGIWAGVLALAHVAVGLQVHMRGAMEAYFLFPPGRGVVRLRYDLFGVVNWLGLIAGLVALGLLLLSNDMSLRKLGSRRWKRLQRWNYLLFLLVLAHAFGYQLTEGRAAGWVATVLLVAGVATIVQAAGYRTRRRALQSNPDG